MVYEFIALNKLLLISVSFGNLNYLHCSIACVHYILFNCIHSFDYDFFVKDCIMKIYSNLFEFFMFYQSWQSIRSVYNRWARRLGEIFCNCNLEGSVILCTTVHRRGVFITTQINGTLTKASNRMQVPAKLHIETKITILGNPKRWQNWLM